jgi:hypothetical protein
MDKNEELSKLLNEAECKCSHLVKHHIGSEQCIWMDCRCKKVVVTDYYHRKLKEIDKKLHPEKYTFSTKFINFFRGKKV